MCGEFWNSFLVTHDDDNQKLVKVRSVRVFAVSAVNPPISYEAPIYQLQAKNRQSNDKKVKIKDLHEYIQEKYPTHMAVRMLIDKQNTVISKFKQNLYVSSLGGITPKSIKIHRFQLMINATHDLPNIDEENIEMLRVPLNSNEPDSVENFLEDIVDKIQASSFKNISTLIYCYDGLCNSAVLVACYFIKYTDLVLNEIIYHIAFTRKGYQEEDKFGCYTEMVNRFAQKYKKL